MKRTTTTMRRMITATMIANLCSWKKLPFGAPAGSFGSPS
jgi:hypothetical protein